MTFPALGIPTETKKVRKGGLEEAIVKGVGRKHSFCLINVESGEL